jgi:hypothetical protein
MTVKITMIPTMMVIINTSITAVIDWNVPALVYYHLQSSKHSHKVGINTILPEAKAQDHCPGFHSQRGRGWQWAQPDHIQSSSS